MPSSPQNDLASVNSAALRIAEKTFQIQRESFLNQLLASPRYSDPRRLNRFEFRVHSQSGQDGILEEIFRRIGTTDRTFVEFGVGAGGGSENNTTYLMAKGWSGKWIEADEKACEVIRRKMDFLLRSSKLTLCQGRVTVENIVTLFEQMKVPTEFDLLSIDIDSHDYWVWRKLSAYRPRAVVLEYNSFLPPSADWVLPYQPDRPWPEMTIEFGASLKAFERAGRELGYTLVGCDLTGSDVFFVRNDLVNESFAGPFTAEEHYEPMRYHLIQSWGYDRTLTPTFGFIQNA